MRKIDSDSIVDLIFQLNWKSSQASHTDCYQAGMVNVWRDYIPPDLLDSLRNKQPGDRVELRLNTAELIKGSENHKLMKVKTSQIDRHFSGLTVDVPGNGRFYPKGMLKGIAGVFKVNMEPFRCVEKNNGHITVDFNHPLAGKELLLSAMIGKIEAKDYERGGISVDWIGELMAGPGMQARWKNSQTDFFSGGAFSREDERGDALFYGKPRFTQHLDDTAIEMVRNTYGRFLTDGMRVLDLMSSWQSHLPGALQLDRAVGLGLNEKELKKNPRLSEHVVQDLNSDPALPFDSGAFDAVICTVSVEYLTRPLAVFEEIGRVLRKDGYFILTFSNRWFPTKAIKVWKEIHEFERMGLVLEYFIRSGAFKGLQTYSFRGLPRPHTDKYFPDLMFSDPIYAVWGQRK